MTTPRSILFADAIADDRGVIAAPGAALVEWAGVGPSARVIEVGSPAKIRRGAPAQAQTRDLAGHMLLPGFVNAHCHLDLTAVGPTPFDRAAGFAGWLGQVRDRRPATDEAIADSVRKGVARSLAGGVVAVGDIAGAWSLIPLRVLRESPMIGVSFVECFGIGTRAEAAGDRLADLLDGVEVESHGVGLGIQPHAPYSAGIALYDRAIRLAQAGSLPLSTHVAESLAERECVVDGRGPIRDFLDSIGVWDDAVAAEFGRARTAVGHLAEPLGRWKWLLAHVNDCTDEDLVMLANAGATIAFCPRASAHFGHPADLGPHRWRDMLAMGVPVALGTDSIISLPADQAHRLSVLDDARLLWRRDRADPVSLVGMMTTAGARALGLAADLFRFSPGRIAGIVALETGAVGGDPLVAALGSTAAPTLLASSNDSCQTGLSETHTAG